MNSSHDVGGSHGFGPVIAEPDEPVFHEEWERHVFAILLGCLAQGLATGNENRYAMERMGNLRYLNTSYYEHWLIAIESLVVEKGIVSREELDQRLDSADRGETDFSRADTRDELARRLLRIIREGESPRRDIDRLPQFRIGDRVRTRNEHPVGHTRLPRYARGRIGTVIAFHGNFVFADSDAMKSGENPQPLYTVAFTGHELWGAATETGVLVNLDLWEEHLEAEEES